MSDIKKYFVDGGILVETPYFRYFNGGAGFGEGAIQGAEPLVTNRKSKDYGDYLLIDDNNPQSIFAEYYARTFFSTGYLWAPMFNKTYEDCSLEFNRKIREIEMLLSLSDHVDVVNVRNLLLRQSMLSVMSAMDTFIADIVLTKITNDKESFSKYAYAFVLKSDVEIIPKIEQRVIDSVLRRSFMNKQVIKDTFSVLFNTEDFMVESNVNNLIIHRHLLAHRGGRKKDGTYLTITRDDVRHALSVVRDFENQVLEVTGP